MVDKDRAIYYRRNGLPYGVYHADNQKYGQQLGKPHCQETTVRRTPEEYHPEITSIRQSESRRGGKEIKKYLGYIGCHITEWLFDVTILAALVVERDMVFPPYEKG